MRSLYPPYRSGKLDFREFTLGFSRMITGTYVQRTPAAMDGTAPPSLCVH